ncbi:MAG: DnaJ domain-containing protein [Deltaproteobacteria bacterium]|nr:DnaJ domain-containing protein [Deltaproteobacteria bacterium]
MSGHPDASALATGRVLLIVTDNPAHRVQFNRHFHEAPHHLVFAEDGEDGFDRFLESKPDLVIAHVTVGQMDGTLLCQLLRQQPRGDKVPMLLVGEELSNPEVARARTAAAGADDALAMPFGSERLLSLVDALLRDGRTHEPVAETSERPTAVGRGEAEVAFGSVLADFVSQTDEGSGTLDLETPQLEAPLARPGIGEGEQGGDMDTVVSFKNPFFEADLPTALAVDPAASAGVAVISPSLVAEEPVTPVGAREENLRPGPLGSAPAHDPAEEPEEPVTRVSSDPLGPGPVTEQRTTPAVAVYTPVDLSAPMGADPDPPTLPSEGLVLGVRPDPLVEPKITSTGASGVRPIPPELVKAQLIEEVPRDATPSGVSGAARASQVAKRANGGQRRGLDESQLGKRLGKRVRTMHRLLDEVDYYQLLGVERGASQADLQRAYFDLSLEFHPDRFFLLRSGDLKEKIYVIYRRIGEAYRILADEERRQAYDEARAAQNAKRAAPELREEARPPSNETVPITALGAVASGDRAVRFIHLAREAFEAGDLNGARLHLTLAQAYEKDNATVRAALRQVTAQLAPSV